MPGLELKPYVVRRSRGDDRFAGIGEAIAHKRDEFGFLPPAGDK
jgi:hypothetical protein